MFVNENKKKVKIRCNHTLVFNNKIGIEPIPIINRWIIILLCIWMVWPYFNYKMGVLPCVALLVLWLSTTDYRWFFKNWTLDLLFILVWIITFIPYIITGNFMYGALDPKYALITIFLFIFGVFVNHYYMFYKKDFITLGRISCISLLMYLIGSIQTYYGLKEFPLASRMLATTNNPMQHVYMSLGIGGFGFVYSSVFITILSLYFIIKKAPNIRKIYRLLSIIFFAFLIIMIIKASYAIALIFTFAGIILVLTVKGIRSLIIGIFLALIFILVIPKDTIGEFILNIAYLFEDNDIIYTKFVDLAQVFLENSTGSQTENRGHLYLTSLNTFIHNPLFGIYGPLGDQLNSKIGGHSGWLDLMAMYGVFGSLPLFLGILLNFKKQLLFYSGHPYFVFLLIVQFLFICFGFLNPVIYVYQIGFAIFVVAPSLPFLPYAFRKKSIKK